MLLSDTFSIHSSFDQNSQMMFRGSPLVCSEVPSLYDTKAKWISFAIASEIQKTHDSRFSDQGCIILSFAMCKGRFLVNQAENHCVYNLWNE